MTTTAVESPRWSRLYAPPRYATRRSPQRETLGPQVGALAGLLGRPPMPHQQLVYDVALEIDPETGELAYDEVVVVINRRQGKTEMGPPVFAHRALELADRVGAPQRTLYTAQTADVAREKWRSHQLALFEASPLRSLFTKRLRLNAEAIIWANGSTHRPVSTTGKTGGTGDDVDLGWLDEAWVHDDTRAEGSMRPAMLTRWQPQLWIVSMVPGPTRAKTTSSSFLRAKQRRGRALVEAGATGGTAYFEWSSPLGLPPGDPATWFGCMPALCPAGPPCRCDPAGTWRHTVFERAIARDFDKMDLADFTAEYLGWWPDEVEGKRWLVISEQEWRNRRRPGATFAGKVAFGVYVTPARDWAAIAAGGGRDGGGRLVEVLVDADGVVDHRPGTTWLLPRLVELDQRHQPAVIVTNDRALADQADKHGLQVVHRAVAGDEASAAAMLFDGIAGAQADVGHLGQPELDAAVALACKRKAGGGWVWEPVEDGADISCAGAASLGLWGYSTPRVHKRRGKPNVW